MRVNLCQASVADRSQARSKNGQPAQTTTGVASANWTHSDSFMPMACRSGSPGVSSEIMNASTGTSQPNADPEPARHVHQFGVYLFARDLARLKRHTTDRAGSRLASNDLRVHRARVFSAHGRWREGRWFQSHPAFRTSARADLADLGVHGTCVFSLTPGVRTPPFPGLRGVGSAGA